MNLISTSKRRESENIMRLPQTLNALLKQEKSQAYNVLNVYTQGIQTSLYQRSNYSNPGSYISSRLYHGAVEMSRYETCDWCYRVVDYFQVDREVVELTMNYLDRILCIRGIQNKDQSCHHLSTRKSVMATTMACLHIAIELSPTQPCCYFRKNPWYSALAHVSHGGLEPSDICKEETNILFELGFRVHPPTALSFIRVMIPEKVLISQTSSDEIAETFFSEVRYLTELAVLNDCFTGYRTSSIAFAILTATLEKLENKSYNIANLFISTSDCKEIERSLATCQHHMNQKEVRVIQESFKQVLDERFPTDSCTESDPQNFLKANRVTPESPQAVSDYKTKRDEKEGSEICLEPCSKRAKTESSQAVSDYETEQDENQGSEICLEPRA